MKPRLFSIALVLFIGACSFAPGNWGDRVPSIPPEAEASRPIVAPGAGVLTITPISVRGAEPGHPYAFDMPHCGILSPIDIDGSFWDAVDVREDPVTFDGQIGTFVLVDNGHATFTTKDRLHKVSLVRHEGPKEFRLCG